MAREGRGPASEPLHNIANKGRRQVSGQPQSEAGIAYESELLGKSESAPRAATGFDQIEVGRTESVMTGKRIPVGRDADDPPKDRSAAA